MSKEDFDNLDEEMLENLDVLLDMEVLEEESAWEFIVGPDGVDRSQGGTDE